MSDLQKVGPDYGGTGTFKPFTSDISAAQRVQDAHGRYFDTASHNAMFFASAQAGQTTTAGLVTTYVGLCLSNPVGSNYALVVNKVSWMWTVIAAAVDGIALAVGYSPATNVTHTTPMTVQKSYYTGSATGGIGKVDTSATLPVAPIYYMFLQDTPTATTNPSGNVVDLEGGLILAPGAYVCFVTPAASSAAAFWPAMQWEELPIYP